MKTLGISLVLILLLGSLVSPIGVLSAFATTQTTPLPPTALNATAVSGTKIFLMWTAPINATQDGVSGYKIEMRPSCSGFFNFLVNTTATSFLSTGLTNATCYQFRVHAINSVGVSSPSNNATATTLSVPSAPTNLLATAVSSSQINLSWATPSNNGGTPITSYKILKSLCAGNPTTITNTANASTMYSDTGLSANTCYQYNVEAVNAIGIGSSSTHNATATTLSVPSAPAKLAAATISSSQINLTWSAPSNNGGTPITGYKIERKTACTGSFITLANTGNSSTYSDTGLTASTCYLYRVDAVNAIGTGLPSPEVVAITNSSLQTHVPSAPTGLHVTTISNSTLKLTWHSPSNSGDSKITGYLIQRNGTIIVSNTLTNQTIFTNTNLLPNHKETYRLAAWNSAGLGAFSSFVSGITMSSTSVSSPGTSGNNTNATTTFSNLGQLISDFVHKRNALLKQQRAEILNAIHECHTEMKNASPDDRKQTHDECKAKIKELREKYKESRKQLQDKFKQIREQFELQIQDEKIKLVNATSIVHDLQKEIKQSEENEQSEKETKHSQNSTANLKEGKPFGNSTGNTKKEMKNIKNDLKKQKGKSEDNKKGQHNEED